MSRPRREIVLLKAFSAPCVLTLQQLGQIFHCSRATILLRLAEHGYYSSYNHSGKFLTIPELAQFDAHGLWTYKTARFSKYGTLKETVACLTYSSPQGMTHQELAALLAVRVHNTLLHLTREGTLRRQRMGPTFVYLHAQRPARSEQVRQRRAALAARPTVRPMPLSKSDTSLVKQSDRLPGKEERVFFLPSSHFKERGLAEMSGGVGRASWGALRERRVGEEGSSDFCSARRKNLVLPLEAFASMR